MPVPCKRCGRHIRVNETACPFCRHGSALAGAALSAGVLLSGCDAGKTKPTQGSAVEAKRPYATISGRVTDRSGAPLANTSVSITLNPTTPSTYFTRSLATDSTGHYMIDLLEPGSYSISYGYRGGMQDGQDQRAVAVHAGEDQQLDVTLDLRDMDIAKPYGAPPARRRTV